MNKKATNQFDEEHLSVLRYVHNHNNEKFNQREIANNLDISLGKLNYLIKQLVKKGFVKIKNFKKSKKKSSYLYVITPQGLSQKIEMTKSFMTRKMREYDELKKEISDVDNS